MVAYRWYLPNWQNGYWSFHPHNSKFTSLLQTGTSKEREARKYLENCLHYYNIWNSPNTLNTFANLLQSSIDITQLTAIASTLLDPVSTPFSMPILVPETSLDLFSKIRQLEEKYKTTFNNLNSLPKAILITKYKNLSLHYNNYTIILHLNTTTLWR